MKLMTVVGTRPEIIRLSCIIPKLDAALGVEGHTFVHTGQNSQRALRDVFFEEFGLRKPDMMPPSVPFGWPAAFASMLEFVAQCFQTRPPDRVLILGDTNSALATAIIATRAGVPIIHLEAGNRCFDLRSPEEGNRRMIDSVATVHLPYTDRAKGNLLDMGVPRGSIFTIGNPIAEVMGAFDPEDDLDRCYKLGLGGIYGPYIVATLHRAETVDNLGKLAGIIHSLCTLRQQSGLPIALSLHPRTADRLPELRGLTCDWKNSLHLLDPPLGFKDWRALAKNAQLVITDSGTVPEEAVIDGVHSLILRDYTERQEITECGGQTLIGSNGVGLVEAARLALAGGPRKVYACPVGYDNFDVSSAVVAIATGVLP